MREYSNITYRVMFSKPNKLREIHLDFTLVYT